MTKPARSKPTISDHFEIADRFMRSVQLERDFGDPAALQTYVVTPDMAAHFQRIARGTAARSSARAWRITGDYGVGKSAFALVCAHLLSDPESAPVARIADALSWPQAEGQTWPFLVTGAREGLASALARGLREGLERRKPKSKAAARTLDQLVAEAIKVERSNDPAAFEAVLKSVIAQAKSAGAGVLLVVDEMGKLLEYAASGSGREDVFLLQKLAELAQRSGETPFFFITLLHQGFHAYAERLPTVTRNEWAKVAERLEEIVFDQPMAHTAALVAGALGVRTESLAPKVRDAAEATARATASMGWMNGATSAALTLQTAQIYPIHPTLLPVLVRFFSRFGQNERSLFGFLLSSEPFGLQAFAEREEGADVWYGLADFYDYVRAMFGHRLSGNSYQSHWLRIAGTVDTSHDLNDLEVRVLKAAALLSLIDYPELLATDTALRACLSPALPRDIDSAIRTLLDRGLLFRRGRTGGYRLWPSTSVNLTAALEEADLALGPDEGVAAHLGSFLDHEPVLARRHYIDYGTMRYFEVRYALNDRVQEAAARPSQADGIVLVVLADTEVQCNLAAERAAAFTNREDLVVGVMAPLATFAAEVHDLRRWGWLRDHTPELAHDPYAAAEVSRQIAAARRALDRALGLAAALRQRNATAITWRHQGEIVDTAAGLSSLLSDFCDTRFEDAPRISNELLNRKMLSSAAAAARMRLIEGLFSSADRPMFGIDVNKAPPEKSMYLSVIERGGVQQNVDGVLTVALPPPDRDPLHLRPALLEIDGMLDAALGGKVRVRAILDRLSDPPYGVRAGVAPLLLAIILKMRSHELAVYENGTFRATFGGTDFTRLVKGPDTFEVQLCRLEGVRADVFARLAAAFAAPVDRRDPQMLDVVQALCVFAAQLPEYTRKAGVLRPVTARVRDVLLSATEPSTMLFVELPAACGLAPFTTFEDSDDQRANVFVEAVQFALHDLRTDYSRLLHRIQATVAASVGQCDDGFDRGALAQRAARVQSAASHIRLKAFAGAYATRSPSDDLWSAAVASYVIAKPPAKWNAADEQRCLEEVTELSQLFHRVEVAAFAKGDQSPTAKSAILVKLTRSSGDDRGLVVQSTALSDRSSKRLEAVRAELGDNSTERLQILTNLIWEELSNQSEAEAEDVPDGGTRSVTGAPTDYRHISSDAGDEPRHILSLSGGKDSAALAIYLRERVPQIEYIFHDTDKELPETYDYIHRLEAILGKPIVRTTPEDSFDHWLAVYKGMLPSNHRRWCTKMLKLKPFEAYVGDGPVINYVGLRADENRTGYISTKPNILAVYPFQDDGLVRADIIRILEASGLGLPPYMDWGRSRSGCFFCFYQQKIEWVRLLETHPKYYELAMGYEEKAVQVGEQFYWCKSESLRELMRPERVQAIKDNWGKSEAKRKASRRNISLVETLGGLAAGDDPHLRDGCLVCSI